MDLIQALKNNNVSLVEEELQQNPNCDINQRDTYGNTLLHVAVTQKEFNIIELLINKGADVNLQNCEGYTPLMNVNYNNKEVVEMFLNAGANVDIQSVGGWTMLHRMCNHEYLEIIEILLRWNANINIKIENMSLFEFFARCNKIHICYFLKNVMHQILTEELLNVWELDY